MAWDAGAGRLRVGPGDGRGAWLCPTAACVGAAARKPGRLGHALRAPQLTAVGLPQAVREHQLRRLRAALGKARRSGLVSADPEDRRDWVAVVRAADAGAELGTPATTEGAAPSVALGPPAATLGAWLGAPPLSQVRVAAGAPGREVAAVLRILRELS